VLFQGVLPIKVDSKGRAGVPKEYRELFAKEGQDSLVLTSFMVKNAPCLDALPVPVWEKFLRKFEKQPQFDEQVEIFGTFYVNPARTVAFDTAGRILIPQPLREWAQLDHEVVVVGALDRFRFWNAELWTKFHQETAKQFPAAKQALASVLS
jgi:MraZ protein